MPVVLVLFISQGLFTISDIIGRYYMKQSGFAIGTFVSLWFFIYVALRTIATFGQLYIFSSLEVGRTMALFSACSLILVNIAGVFFLGEVLPLRAYLGIMLAIAAILVLSITS